MSYLFSIIHEIIGPILLLLVIGAFLQRRFQFDLRSFSHLITYALLPAAVFINLLETTIDRTLFVQLMMYLILFSVALMFISHLLAKLLHLDQENAATFKNSIVLINSGNYGLPVSQMIFIHHPIGVSIQIITMIFQNITTYTYGLYQLIATSQSGLAIARELFRLPIIHALWIGILLNSFSIQLPTVIQLPIEQMAQGFLPLALLLLGAQLSQIELKKMFHPVMYWSAFGRLVLGPVVAFILILLFKMDGVVAHSLFIASAFPTSRNSSTLAFEYQVNADVAAQMVLFSTLLSALTVTFVIYIADFLWPLL